MDQAISLTLPDESFISVGDGSIMQEFRSGKLYAIFLITKLDFEREQWFWEDIWSTSDALPHRGDSHLNLLKDMTRAGNYRPLTREQEKLFHESVAGLDDSPKPDPVMGDPLFAEMVRKFMEEQAKRNGNNYTNAGPNLTLASGGHWGGSNLSSYSSNQASTLSPAQGPGASTPGLGLQAGQPDVQGGTGQ